MKRSEMVKNLAYSIWRRINYYGPTSTDEMLASDILQDIEDLGMLPPGYMKPISFEDDGKQYPLIPGDFKNDNGIWCTPGINEWESEDGQT